VSNPVQQSVAHSLAINTSQHTIELHSLQSYTMAGLPSSQTYPLTTTNTGAIKGKSVLHSLPSPCQ